MKWFFSFVFSRPNQPTPVWKRLPPPGFEPRTFRTAGECSTAELWGRIVSVGVAGLCMRVCMLCATVSAYAPALRPAAEQVVGFAPPLALHID